jgi:hypothetical protein
MVKPFFRGLLEKWLWGIKMAKMVTDGRSSMYLQKASNLSKQWGPPHFSLKLGNWTKAKEDINLLAKVVRWEGVFGMFPVLLSMPLVLIWRFTKHVLGKNYETLSQYTEIVHKDWQDSGGDKAQAFFV